MFTRCKQEDKVVSLNLGKLLNDLLSWYRELGDDPCDDIRIAMLDSFEDLIFDSIDDEEDYD